MISLFYHLCVVIIIFLIIKFTKKKKDFNNQIIEVDTIDGFSMLINKTKFNNSFFDENIFLYLENDDICLRARKNNQKIYIVKNSLN